MQRQARGLVCMVFIAGAALPYLIGADETAPLGTYTPSQRQHWAFVKRSRPQAPQFSLAADRTWVKNPIDAFILARLKKEGLRPSPPADRATLIRRVYFDLIGLPPSPAEVTAFIADKSPDSYARLVERLLASPHYGERWGRHWLDLARYADSDGYEKDLPRPHAWRFRQWVIEALNRDLPFDQFTIEQLAGDLLPGGLTEPKIATGFHRNTLTNTSRGKRRKDSGKWPRMLMGYSFKWTTSSRWSSSASS